MGEPKQGSLFDRPPPAQEHSATSRAAARQIRHRASELRERVYRFIQQHGPVTDEEIAEALKMNPSTERPRRIELVDESRVRADGEKRTRSGRRATAWRAA